MAAGNAIAARLDLLAREPALAAHAARGQARYAEELSVLVAIQMQVNPADDLRPRLLVSAVLGALNAAYAAWATDRSRNLAQLVDEAHDLLDTGFAAASRTAHRSSDG